MILGADYQIEQWPEQRWPEDARLMQEAGISAVRIGSFAWSRLEPDDNYYNLRWLNRAMDLLLKNGIKVVIGLPTSSPPPWLVHKFPDILPLDADGRRVQPGLYNHRCFLSKHYHDYARNFTMRLTKEIWGHRAIIGWEIGNRLGAHRCFCETCHRAFLEWLKKKYKDVETLNAAWGTAAWGQEYNDFIQIPLPWNATIIAINPSLQLDFTRFHSDVALEFYREQAIIVQRYTTRQFITFTGLASGIDSFELAKSLDFMSCANLFETSGLALDRVRGQKQKPFWVMEQEVAAMGERERGPQLIHGRLRACAWRAIGHGADAIVFSPWRSHLSGATQTKTGLLGHDGLPRRRFQEAKRLGEEVAKVGPLLDGSLPRNETAVLWDQEQTWATGFYGEMACQIHSGMTALGLGCDVVSWQQDFAPYKLLLCSPQYLLDASRARKLIDFVAGGGRAVAWTGTGIANVYNVRHAEPAPAFLRELLGIEIVETDVIRSNSPENGVRLASGQQFHAYRYCDVLETKGAEVLGRYTEKFYKDAPALTVHSHGKGRAYYVGTMPDNAFYPAFLGTIAGEMGLRICPDLPSGVEVVSRFKDGKDFLFVINQTGEPRKANLGRRGRNLIDGNPVDSIVALEPYGVAVIAAE